MQKIRLAIPTSKTISQSTNAFRPARPRKGLQQKIADWMWKYLIKHRFIIEYFEPVYITEYAKTAPKSVEEQVIAIFNNENFDPRDLDKHLLICGEKTYMDLCNNNRAMYQHFVTSTQIGYNGKMWGVDIHVVPYVDGWAIVPKKIIEIRRETYG